MNNDLNKLKKYCKYWPDTYFKIISIKSSGITYLITTSSDNKPIILNKTNTKSKLDMIKEFGFNLKDGIHLDFIPGFIEKISISFYNNNEYIPRFFCENTFDEID